MANSNGSFGLRPLSKMGSAANSTGLSNYSMYEIANGNTDKLYHGEPVIPLSTGFIGAPGAAAGGTVGLLGVFQGCEYVASTTGKPTWSNYWPGSGADSNHPIKAYVNDDPMQLYVIATDATGTDATGLSLGRLAISTIATTAALQMRVMGWLEDDANSDFTAAGIGAIVRLNNHFNSNNGAIAAGTPSTTGV